MTETNSSDTSTPTAEQLTRLAQIRTRRAATNRRATPAALASSNPDLGPPNTNLSTSDRDTRAVTTTSKRRHHVAQRSRIVAAGLGATTMFGIVAVLGLDNPVSGTDTPPPTQPAAVPPVQVVIHRIPATTNPTALVVEAPVVDPAAVPASVAPPEPVQLTANPVVRTVTVAPPSRPRSSGSSSPTPRAAPAPAPTPAATTGGSG